MQFVSQTNRKKNHRQEDKTHLEHTELLTDVGKTLGLLGFVVNDVESDSLGKRSTITKKQ